MTALTKALIGQDLSAELKDECGAHLDTLMALGLSKTQYYAEKINTDLLGAGQGTNRTFPISSIQSFIYQTKAYTSDNANNITDMVNSSISDFVSGDNKSAVSTLVSGFVNILFGSSEGSESEVLRYCAILEGASMVRLDFAGWSRVVTSSALKSKCDKVSSFVLYRSIVDMSKVTLNDFIQVYQVTVKAENKDLDIAGVVKKCQDLYYVFNPKSKPLNHVADLALNLNSPAPFEPSVGHTSLDIFRKKLISL
ncbi:hypothetical protein [Citrobacter tructae]|uniref:hypothetical protein n=1 Tax=Citrobacter tructae TaxID=2562449 RepID=UPI003F55CB6B